MDPNQLAGHLHFRPRPYWACPPSTLSASKPANGCCFCDHITIAAAAAARCLILARRWVLPPPAAC
jgi:hypothetical protein